MILNMTYAGRLTPSLPCSTAFGGRGVEIIVPHREQGEEGTEEAVFDK
jgi:hypothetical protein